MSETDARDEALSEEPCRSTSGYQVCATHPACEEVQKVLADLRESYRIYFDRWRELVEYQESLDMLLDEAGVPRKHAGGAEMYLLARLKTLIEKANQRSRLAYRFYQVLTRDYGSEEKTLRSDMKALIQEAHKEFEVAP